MSDYDGDDFKAIDEDGYTANRPMSAGLDHAARNNLQHLGRFGAQCSYSERLDVDGVAAKVYSGNPSSRSAWLLRASSGLEGYEAHITVAGGPSAATATGSVWLAVLGSGIGLVEGSKVAVSIGSDVIDYDVVTLTVEFDAPLTSDQTLLVCVMQQSARYDAVETQADIGAYPMKALQVNSAPYGRAFVAGTKEDTNPVELLYDDETSGGVGADSQFGAPTPSSKRDGNDNYVRRLTWISSPSVELRELRDTYETFDSGQIRAHDSVEGAQIVPRHDRGGGANFRASEHVFTRWHTASIGTQYADEPNGDWEEFPRWTYVSSSDVTRTVPVVPINDAIDLAGAFGVIAYDTGFGEYTQDGALRSEDEIEITATLELLASGGSTLETINFSSDVPVYKRELSGASVFFTQMHIRNRYVTGAPVYYFREGQLFDLEEQGGFDERQIVSPLVESTSVTGLTAGQMYGARWTFEAVTGDVEYVVVTMPTIQQYVTRST